MGAAAFLALFALLLTTSNFPNQAHSQDSPSVAISLSPSGSVEPGTAITAAMSFGNLASDSDTSTTDYIFPGPTWLTPTPARAAGWARTATSTR